MQYKLKLNFGKKRPLRWSFQKQGFQKKQKYHRFEISKKFLIFPTFLRLSTFYVVTIPTGVNFHI